MNKFGFNLRNEDFSDMTPDLIPDGNYNVTINRCEITPSKKNREGINGYEKSYNLMMEYVILDNNDQNSRSIREWLAIHNPNSTAQRIARKKLSDIGAACGVPVNSVQSPDDLIDKKISIFVSKDKYGDNNVIKKYSRCNIVNQVINRDIGSRSADLPF